MAGSIKSATDDIALIVAALNHGEHEAVRNCA